jgi:hypothetical protein
MAYQSKSYRKFVATAATATLVASAVTPAFAASFTDVSDRYKEAVDYLVEQEITNGINETTFGTNQTIKRVDAAVLIAKALDLDVENAKDAGFKDVPNRAVSYVNALKEEGIINGKTATSFGSAQNITRGEMALIIARAYDLEGNKANLKFTDVSDRYDEAVAALVDNKITFGKTDTQFGTSASVTRGEFALFLHRLAPAPGTPTIKEVSAVNDITVNEGAASVTLPSTVEVTLSDDKKATKAVVWNQTNLKLNTPGTYTLKGDVADTDLEASVKVVVKAVDATIEEVSAVNDITVNEGVASVNLPSTVQVTLSNDEKATKAVVWNQTNLKLNTPGTYTLKGDVADTDLETSVKVVVKEVAPSVVGVSAINATQVKVTFNKAVDKTTAEAEANYKFNTAALSTYDGSATAVLQEDLKSVVVTFSASKNNTSFTFGVDGVKTADQKAIAVYSGTVAVADKEAPTVAKSEFLANGNLEVTFSEPLTVATPVVRVDGKPVTGSVSGNKVVVTAAALTSAGATVAKGATASLYVASVTDTVGNEAALYNGTVTKPNDTTKPAITSITQVGHNQLKVVFSEALGASASDLATGEFKFLKGASVLNSTDATLDTDDTTNKTYIVTFSATDIYGSSNPVDSQAVTLLLDADAVKDAADNGNASFTQGFTFNADKTGPKLVSAVAASDKETLELTFDEAFTSGTTNVDESKIVVTDANGVRYAVQDATTDVKAGPANTKVLVVDFIAVGAASQVIANGNYTVQLQAGAIKDARSNNSAVASTTVTVGDAADTTKPVTALGSSTQNSFVVNFGEEVTSSALQLANYKLDGAALPAGTVIYFNSAAKTGVTIELPAGSQNIGVVGTGTAAILNVTNVADKAGNVADTKNLTVSVADNTSATLQTVQTLGNDIVLTFNEAIDSTTATAINDATKLAADFEIKVGGEVLNLGTLGTAGTDGSAATVATSLVAGNDKQVKISITPQVNGTGYTGQVASNWDNAKPLTVKVKGSTLKDANLFLLSEGSVVSK